MPIKVVIADDHQLFRQGMAFIIGNYPEFQLLYDVEDGAELLRRLESEPENQPDVVLMDLKMPQVDGMAATKSIKANYPNIKILILSMIQQEDFVLHLLDEGANGYLLKNASAEEVAEAIRTVSTRDFYFNEFVSGIMLRGLKKKRQTKPQLAGNYQVTPREQEVLNLIAQEFTTTEMAERLFVSVRTIETHRKNLMDKLGAKNTAGLMFKAMKNGLLNTESDSES